MSSVLCKTWRSHSSVAGHSRLTGVYSPITVRVVPCCPYITVPSRFWKPLTLRYSHIPASLDIHVSLGCTAPSQCEWFPVILISQCLQDLGNHSPYNTVTSQETLNLQNCTFHVHNTYSDPSILGLLKVFVGCYNEIMTCRVELPVIRRLHHNFSFFTFYESKTG
jgi:hypothetical protein